MSSSSVQQLQQQQQMQKHRSFTLPDGVSASELSSELHFLREELLAKQEEQQRKLDVSSKQLQPQKDDEKVLFDEALELISEFHYGGEQKAVVESRLGLAFDESDIDFHKKLRPAAVRTWGSRSNSCSSGESEVLQLDGEGGGAFAAAVTRGCVQGNQAHPITARFKIISLRSIICIGFLRSVQNAAHPTVPRDLLELRPSEMLDLCACRSNGTFKTMARIGSKAQQNFLQQSQAKTWKAGDIIAVTVQPGMRQVTITCERSHATHVFDVNMMSEEPELQEEQYVGWMYVSIGKGDALSVL